MRLVRSFFSTSLAGVLILTLVLLAGCSPNGLTAGILPTMDLNVQVTPLKFTASTGEEGGVSFESEDFSITVSSKPGSVGGYINSYSIAYAFADGTEVSPGTSNVRGGGLGLRVQPGLICPASGEGEAQPSCDVLTSKANFAPGAAVTATGVQGVPGEIAYYYWCNYRVDVGARALLTLSGVSDLGQTYTWRGEVAIDSNGDFLPANLSKPSICEGA